MNDVHPGPQAGDGKIIDQSRYVRPDDPPDNRRQCAQCGWYFNDDANTQGDTFDDPLNTPTVITVSNTIASLPQPLKSCTQFLVSSKTVQDPTDNNGCPLCRTMNPQAVGRDNDPFLKSLDMSDWF